jgi:Gram-negative bacterial TonB protein C-terminal
MRKVGLCFCTALLFATPNRSAEDSELFQRVLAHASNISTLILSGVPPFHLRLSAVETRHNLPEYRAEIEMWWASPDKWRREVHAKAFSQTAVRNGERYFESNSADYLPFWLHELLQASVDPLPPEGLVRSQVELTKGGCAQWQEPYAKDKETITVHHSICFNADGTVRQLFTPTISVELSNYGEFADKRIARLITAWPVGGAEVHATVDSLEPLQPEDSLFVLPDSTPFPARLRFVSVREAFLQLDTQTNAPLTWPVVHNFPATGVMAVNVKLDREGKVREVGSIVSSNFVLTDAASQQILKWKFKPYFVEGSPVQVNATLAIHFDAKMELLGTSGKVLPVEPLLERMKKSRQLSDPRSIGSAPFHLHATLQERAGQHGTYDEIWESPENWRREIHLGPITMMDSRNGEETSHKLTDTNRASPEITYLLDLLVAGHFPDRHYEVYEADWGQSAVTSAGVDTVRVARGKVDKDNQPISGQAYWFDFLGLLRGDYEEPTTTTYSEFLTWNNKQVPRRLEVTANGTRKWLVLIDKLEPIPAGVPPEDSTAH